MGGGLLVMILSWSAHSLPFPVPPHREPSFGHATLDILNDTHALFQWKRNADPLSGAGMEVEVAPKAGLTACSMLLFCVPQIRAAHMAGSCTRACSRPIADSQPFNHSMQWWQTRSSSGGVPTSAA